MANSQKTARVAGILFVSTAVAYGAWSLSFEGVAMGDPLGPRAYPILLAVLTAVAGIYLVIRPDATTGTWPAIGVWLRMGGSTLIFVAYTYLLVPLGFISATALTVFGLALVFRGPVVKSAAGAVVFSVGTYCLFSFALDLPLPVGWWFQ